MSIFDVGGKTVSSNLGQSQAIFVPRMRLAGPVITLASRNLINNVTTNLDIEKQKNRGSTMLHCVKRGSLSDLIILVL